MKKAKVLVPALSLLCFSAVACVTSTVAWFTTVTNASISTSNYKIEALEGSMNAVCVPAVGTKLGASAGEITPKDNCALTHASVNPVNQTVWTINQFDSTYCDPVGAGKDLSLATDDQYFRTVEKETVYYAFSWVTKFTYNFGTSTTAPKMNIYFDGSSPTDGGSLATPSQDLDDLDAMRGFRMAFINTKANAWMVWSPFQGKTMDTGSNPGPDSAYVKESNPESNPKITTQTYDPGTSSSTGNLHYKGETMSRIGGSSGLKTVKGYLGTFDTLAPDIEIDDQGKRTATVDILCVAWFEGLDPNVVNLAKIDKSISATIKFYLRNDGTPAS